MNNTAAGFKHKDEWKRMGKNHCVVVSRHASYDEAENNWCVYLYIYPAHIEFGNFDPSGKSHEQPHFECHSYVSLFKVNTDQKGNVTSYQLGWDYSHYGDHHYSECATADDAGSVFLDANNLFEDASNE